VTPLVAEGRPPGATVWFTGLPGAGKTTIAGGLADALAERSVSAVSLDGDELRTGLNADLGFSLDDRIENIRRVGEVARLFAMAGHVVLVSLISPFGADREMVRARHEAAALPFVLVHVSTSLAVCEGRDPKGHYARARLGELEHFTGVSDPYEIPVTADVVVDTEGRTPAESTAAVVAVLESLLLMPRTSMA
jgi:bifunctional enzyme CysN/CysC